MSASSFIKENKVLVAGIILPFLLIAALMLARLMTFDPPQYKALFYVSKSTVKGTIEVKVNGNGRISAAFQPKDSEDTAIVYNAVGTPNVVLYLYDGKSRSLESTEITLDQNEQVTPLQKFQDLEILPGFVSPDGYEFRSPYYSNKDSILIDVFGGHQYYRGPVIKKINKDNYVIEIMGVNDYNSAVFLGWVNEGAVK